MFTTSKIAAAAAIVTLCSHSLASTIPATFTDSKVVPRAGGYPDSNPPGVSCFNTWETVTNDVSIKPHGSGL